jgi:Uncharacterized conserved protein (DUF2190)
MKNMTYTVGQFGSVALALPVPLLQKSGEPVLLGAAGLYGVCLTDAATTASITAGLSAQGLKDGEATVLMPGILYAPSFKSSVAAIAQFDKIYYKASTKEITNVPAGATFIGYALQAVTAINQIFKGGLISN